MRQHQTPCTSLMPYHTAAAVLWLLLYTFSERIPVNPCFRGLLWAPVLPQEGGLLSSSFHMESVKPALQKKVSGVHARCLPLTLERIALQGSPKPGPFYCTLQNRTYALGPSGLMPVAGFWLQLRSTTQGRMASCHLQHCS